MKLAFSDGAASRGWRGPWVPGHLRRRLLAAAMAAAAVLIGLSSLHRPLPAAASRTASRSPSQALLAGLGRGQVAAPIRLVDPGVAPLLRAGLTVDVLAAPQSPDGSAPATPARVIAQGVRVLAVTAPTAGETSAGTLVVLAVSRADAQALAGAEAGGRLSVTLEAG